MKSFCETDIILNQQLNDNINRKYYKFQDNMKFTEHFRRKVSARYWMISKAEALLKVSLDAPGTRRVKNLKMQRVVMVLSQ